MAAVARKHKVGFTNQQIADQMLSVHFDLKRAKERGDSREAARLNLELGLLGEQIQSNMPAN
jgi:hypothetical protein